LLAGVLLLCSVPCSFSAPLDGVGPWDAPPPGVASAQKDGMLAAPPAAVAKAWNAVESALSPLVTPSPDEYAVHSPNFAGPVASGPAPFDAPVALVGGVVSSTAGAADVVGGRVVLVVWGWSPAAMGKEPVEAATAMPPPRPTTVAAARTAMVAWRCPNTVTS